MFMGFLLTWFSKLQYKISLRTTEEEYIELSQSIYSLIGVREVIKEIQTFVISGKTQNPKYCTHSEAFVLDDIPPSKFYENNEACLKFATIPTIYPCINHIDLSYHLFLSKVEALKIVVISINTNDQLEDQFTKGLQEGKFELAHKNIIEWQLMNVVES